METYHEDIDLPIISILWDQFIVMTLLTQQLFCWRALYFPKTTKPETLFRFYRVSHNWVLTLFCLFSRLPVLVQTFILPFFNSPGDVDSKTHLTFLPTSKIDQVTEQNVRQPWFRYNLDKPCMYQKNNIYIQFASRFAL